MMQNRLVLMECLCIRGCWVSKIIHLHLLLFHYGAKFRTSRLFMELFTRSTIGRNLINHHVVWFKLIGRSLILGRILIFPFLIWPWLKLLWFWITWVFSMTINLFCIAFIWEVWLTIICLINSLFPWLIP